MSDTPRTDVAQHNMGSIVEPHYVVDADFSRYLERELVEAQEELNDKRKFCYAVEQALDGMKGDYIAIISALRREFRKSLLKVAERKPVPEFELIEKWEGE